MALPAFEQNRQDIKAAMAGGCKPVEGGILCAGAEKSKMAVPALVHNHCCNAVNAEQRAI